MEIDNNQCESEVNYIELYQNQKRKKQTEETFLLAMSLAHFFQENKQDKNKRDPTSELEPSKKKRITF